MSDRTSLVINTIVSWLGPWYPIRFVHLDSEHANVLVCIGSHRVVARCTAEVPSRVWISRSTALIPESEVQFLTHLNGILAGKVRNDAGELVSA